MQDKKEEAGVFNFPPLFVLLVKHIHPIISITGQVVDV